MNKISGLDERPNFSVPNNVFYRIFESIREDWTCGVGERGRWLLEILPRTSVREKEKMREHLEEMMEAWWQVAPDEFDGRNWTRDGPFCCLEPEVWVTDWKYIHLFDTNDDIFEEMLYDDAAELYAVWKAGTLTWKETRR